MTHTRDHTGGICLSIVHTQDSAESHVVQTFSTVRWYFETSLVGRGFDSLKKDFQTEARGSLHVRRGQSLAQSQKGAVVSSLSCLECLGGEAGVKQRTSLTMFTSTPRPRRLDMEQTFQKDFFFLQAGLESTHLALCLQLQTAEIPAV